MKTWKNLKHRLGLAVVAGLLATLTASPAGARVFGTACQEEFEDSDLGSLHWIWERCSGFNNELDNTDQKRFYYNLHGDNWWLHDASLDPNANDSGTLDNVDLFYISTHGAAWESSSVWAMYDTGQRAYSFLMRLGDEALGQSIFASYSCETMKVSDGKVRTRLGPMFDGGLRYIAGSHGTIYDSPTTDEAGEDFADNLQMGFTLRNAWKSANSDFFTNQDLIVLSTGVSFESCTNRRDTMKWSNYSTYPRIQNGTPYWICWQYWNNL